MLLHRKCRPPGLPSGVVARHRLDDLLSRLLEEHEAVAMFAAAGSGKTVQAQMFAVRFGWPLAWLTLDVGDRSASRFLIYLAQVLEPFAPEVTRQVEESLDAGFSFVEVAAMLAESLGDLELLIVLDNCESLADSEEAADALNAFLDYLPPRVRALILSREELGFSIGRMMLQGRVGKVADDDLALDVDEVRAMLAALGETGRDPTSVMEATGGWVAGLAFDIGAKLKPTTGPDALAKFLNREVLDRLPEEEQRFLVRTSLLQTVTARSAVALCGRDGHRLWQQVGSRHLPATLTPDRAIVYHPRFREYLREQLQIRYPDEIPELQRRYAGLLEELNEFEGAVEVFIEVGDLERAADAAQEALPEILRRADWGVVLDWVGHFGHDRVEERPALQGALVRALYGTRQLPEAQALIRRLHRCGRLSVVAAVDPGVVAYTGWALQWRPSEALEFISEYEGDYRADAVRYELRAVSSADSVVPPQGVDWLDMERIMSWGLLVQGRLDELLTMLPSDDEWPPRGFYRTPHPLLGLIWRGEHVRARALWDEIPEAVREGAHTDLWFFHEAWLLWGEGDLEGAWRAAQAAVDHSRKTHFGWEPCFEVAVGYMLINLDRIEDARSVLADSIGRSASSGMRAYVEWGQTFQGLAFLRSGRDRDAARVLRLAVEAMQVAERRLMLPFAGAYLAEAAHRIGEEDEASEAADLAYEAAHAMGALFILQRALADVPGVLPRQIERDATETKWRRVFGIRSRVTSLPGTPLIEPSKVLIDIHTFGPDADIVVNGVPTGLRRLKVIELAAFLSLHPEGVDRQRVQDRLFPETDQRRGGNYFRQVVHKFRQCTGLRLSRDRHGIVLWPSDAQVDSADARFERLIGEANALSGTERLERLLAALDLVQGSYLQESSLSWAESRRFELDVLTGDVRTEAAQLALDLEKYELARDVAEHAIVSDPFCEAAYQVLMRVEAAIGAPGAVLIEYQRLCRALEELGVGPDAVTKRLVEELRVG